ncbi:hypothetical protein [Micromonospora sp. DT31]|uniref:hypothetical protein n=1 Tax=Micromonospora sp. DT31 TaxID=3393434 RepID=UPI003CECAC80
MRGDLDETLARMARREDALRRRGDTTGDVAGMDTPGHEPDDGRAAHGAHRLRGGVEPTRRNPVEEVAAAVRRVVAEHPGIAVTLRVEVGDQAYPMRISWSGATVTVGPVATPTPPPAWPMSVKTVPDPGQEPVESDPAARLAEMIRRDPSLLDGPAPS